MQQKFAIYHSDGWRGLNELIRLENLDGWVIRDFKIETINTGFRYHVLLEKKDS